jgi:hypothetical protein
MFTEDTANPAESSLVFLEALGAAFLERWWLRAEWGVRIPLVGCSGPRGLRYGHRSMAHGPRGSSKSGSVFAERSRGRIGPQPFGRRRESLDTYIIRSTALVKRGRSRRIARAFGVSV